MTTKAPLRDRLPDAPEHRPCDPAPPREYLLGGPCQRRTSVINTARVHMIGSVQDGEKDVRPPNRKTASPAARAIRRQTAPRCALSGITAHYL